MDPDTIDTLNFIKDLIFTVILIYVLLKIASGHSQMGDAAAKLQAMLHVKWQGETKNSATGSPANDAYQILFREFLASNPHYRNSTQSAQESEFAAWLKEKKKTWPDGSQGLHFPEE